GRRCGDRDLRCRIGDLDSRGSPLGSRPWRSGSAQEPQQVPRSAAGGRLPAGRVQGAPALRPDELGWAQGRRGVGPARRAYPRPLQAAGPSSLAIEKAQARAIPISSDPPPRHAGQGSGGGPASYFRDGDNLPLLATVPIPGVFTMGAPPEDVVAELNELPAVAIRLEQAFAISVFPITNADRNLAAARRQKDVAPRPRG